MSQPFVGQLLLVPYNFAPQGWALCQGQLMAISENTTLFQLIGTTYGGDGQQTFALPDLRGRTPIGTGTSANSGTTYTLGDNGGVEQVTLTVNQMPAHTHTPGVAGAVGDSQHANGDLLGDGQNIYRASNPLATMAAVTLSSQGGSQPHDNLQPYLALNWIISLFGIFPTPN